MPWGSDTDNDRLSSNIRRALDETIKLLNTSLPAKVISFDAATARCSVLPAIDVLGKDGLRHQRPPMVDVPVLYPSAGGYRMTFPLSPGDPVMLLVSQRGFESLTDASAFAAGGSFDTYPPRRGRVMQMPDAVVIPGFANPAVPVPLDAMDIQVPQGGKLTINGQPAFDHVGPLIATVPILSGAALTAKTDWTDITNQDITFAPDFPMSLRFGIGYIDFLGSINFPKFYDWPEGVEGLLVQVRDSDDAVVSETSFAKTATDLFNETVGGSPRQIPAAIRWRWNEMFVSSVPSGSDTAWTAHATQGGHGTFFVGRRLRPTRGSFLYRTMKPPNMAAPAGLTLQYRFKVSGGAGIV